jgi:hypothetical protein
VTCWAHEVVSDLASASISARYRRFAETEARGRSPLYEAVSLGVAGDQDALDFLMTLPTGKTQPNLLLAAVRHLFGVAADWPDFRRRLLDHTDAVRSVMLTHATQTNEPARCAVLLPILAKLPQPLALLEVGASAGLCLLPECYGYDYPGLRILPKSASAKHPVFACAASQTTPLPHGMPRVVWRAGLDLNPLDVADASQAAWLETLVWPEQTQRLAALRDAIGLAALHRPNIVKGDLAGNGLAALCRSAPRDATLVVFHTAVLAYVADRGERQAFAMRVRSLCDYWVSNEARGVFAEAATGIAASDTPGRFLLSVNGDPVAWTDPHGAAIEWIAAPGWAARPNVRTGSR